MRILNGISIDSILLTVLLRIDLLWNQLLNVMLGVKIESVTRAQCLHYCDGDDENE